MKPRSLRARLLLISMAATLAALLVTGTGLVILFEKHVERRFAAELDAHVNQLIAGINATAEGIELKRRPADPAFDVPLSGLYWQVTDLDHQVLLRSRSLWDQSLPLPEDRLTTGEVHQHRVHGPRGEVLIVRERRIRMATPNGVRHLRVAAAVDRATLHAMRNAFALDMLPYLLLVGLVLLASAWIQSRVGLAPLERLRAGVLAIREGRLRRLTGRFPEEIRPLVEELNALLASRDQAVERARSWTADLAHGLKTPLTALGAHAQRLRERGEDALADELDRLAEHMRARIDRELVRARIRSTHHAAPVRSKLQQGVDAVVRTLRHTPKGAEIEWTLDIPADLEASVRTEDLTELLGNLLENAVKWARGRIRVSAGTSDGGLWLRIDDDGPGVPPEACDRLMERGVRLDEQREGQGLGLAIAHDILEAAGGDIRFGRSPLGGLEVEVRLPIP